jgi:hypothetical protein
MPFCPTCSCDIRASGKICCKQHRESLKPETDDQKKQREFRNHIALREEQRRLREVSCPRECPPGVANLVPH